MHIELKSIPIRDLIDGYESDPDRGVHGYGGRLDIRPPYQREFRYDEKPYNRELKKTNKGPRDGDLYLIQDGKVVLPYVE